MYRSSFVVLVFIALFNSLALSQDGRELDAERAARPKLKGEHPIALMMKAHPVELKKELEGVHPRVFVTQGEIEALKNKARSEKALWQTALDRVRSTKVDPPPPPAETRRAQNDVGLAIAEAAFVYKITGE